MQKTLDKTMPCMIIYFLQTARPFSQVAKTSPSHGEGRGSTPLKVIKARIRRAFLLIYADFVF